MSVIRKMVISGIAVLSLFGLSLNFPTVEASARYEVAAKNIILNGVTVAKPVGLVSGGTTYIPIYYIMHSLTSLGITSNWDGFNWNMKLPSTLKPSVNLSTVRPGTGPKKIRINGTDVQNVPSIVYQDPYSHVNTTYIPIWYVMKVLKYENINSKWNGTTWSMTYSSPVAVVSSVSTSGIGQQPQLNGGVKENWLNNSEDVLLQNLSYQPGSNFIPIEGKVDGNDQGDVLVCDLEGNNQWIYSLPIQSDGTFSGDVELPYAGDNQLIVGLPQTCNTSFTVSQNAAYADFNNSQPSLSEQQMALLESWMVNYTENSMFPSLAEQITKNSTTTDDKIKDVSNWVSSHIDYNFQEESNNQFMWQQATDTLKKQYGVCQDEASVVAAILRSIGVPTEVEVGEAYDPNTGQDLGGHAWNRVYDGSNWIYVDPTWDQVYYQDTTIAAPVEIDDTYFNMNSATFLQSHHPDSTQPYAWMYLHR